MSLRSGPGGRFVVEHVLTRFATITAARRARNLHHNRT